MIEVRDKKTGRKNKLTKLIEAVFINIENKEYVWYDAYSDMLVVGNYKHAAMVAHTNMLIFGESATILIGEL